MHAGQPNMTRNGATREPPRVALRRRWSGAVVEASTLNRRPAGGPKASIAVDWKGLDAATLLEAGIERDVRGVVRVPYRYASGAEANAKLFAPNGRSCWERRGLGLMLFGLELLPPADARSSSSVMLLEGESDALAVRGAITEWRGQPVYALGVPGASSWHHEWRDHLLGFARVYVAPDGDAAGQAMLARIWRDVSGARWVRMPLGEDTRSIIQQPAGADRFCELVKAADRAAAEWVAFRSA
jgi:hypothetical protein